jgi:hypothetical protein
MKNMFQMDYLFPEFFNGRFNMGNRKTSDLKCMIDARENADAIAGQLDAKQLGGAHHRLA